MAHFPVYGAERGNLIDRLSLETAMPACRCRHRNRRDPGGMASRCQLVVVGLQAHGLRALCVGRLHQRRLTRFGTRDKDLDRVRQLGRVLAPQRTGYSPSGSPGLYLRKGT